MVAMSRSDQMFQLTRFFLITSAVSLIAIALVVGFLWQNAVTQLVEYAEGQNLLLAQSFANNIRQPISQYAHTSVDGVSRPFPDAKEIGDALRSSYSGLPVLKVKLYGPDGITIYSTDPSEIGANASDNPGFSLAAKRGEPASKLTFRDQISSFEGTVQDRDLVESYLPIRFQDGPIEGVFELYSDVTPLLARIRRGTNELVAAFGLVFVFLYGSLFLLVRRADRTIKHQYVSIADRNTALATEIRERKEAQGWLRKAHDELEERVAERTRDLEAEISERKRIEEDARRQRAEMTHVGRIATMGEMVTSLAHELNQPFAVISGCAQLCRQRLSHNRGAEAKVLDALDQIVEQTGRATAIIARIRGFVHKDAPARTVIDVNKTINDVAELLRSDAREHDASVEFNFAKDLPFVSADAIQIQQVVLNLAHNGLEAMSESASGTRLIKVQTARTPEPHQTDSVEVSVSDTGEGVPADVLDQIFEPYFTTKLDGVGMGLSICRTIIESHAGRLWATSEKGGAIFRFILPSAWEVGKDES